MIERRFQPRLAINISVASPICRVMPAKFIVSLRCQDDDEPEMMLLFEKKAIGRIHLSLKMSHRRHCYYISGRKPDAGHYAYITGNTLQILLSNILRRCSYSNMLSVTPGRAEEHTFECRIYLALLALPTLLQRSMTHAPRRRAGAMTAAAHEI